MSDHRAVILLVVGFGPFPSVPRNPSGDLARRLAGSARLRRVLGTSPRCLVMRTAYAAIATHLVPALRDRPDAVLMIGLAKRARRMRVEERARNRVSRLFPDVSGRIAARPLLDPDGPPVRRRPHAARAVWILRGHGVAASLSRDAGRYLCNASYFTALAEDRPTLFVHIPPPPRADRSRPAGPIRRQSMADRWVCALAEVALDLARQSRRPSA